MRVHPFSRAWNSLEASLDSVAVFVALPEVNIQIVPQARLVARQFEHTPYVPLQIGIRVELVLGDYVPALHISAIIFSAMPRVLNRGAFEKPDILVQMAQRTALPLHQRPHIAWRYPLRHAQFDLADQSERHVVITRS